MGPREYLQILALLLLCLVQLFIGRLEFLQRDKGWLSFSGGAAAAYVFVYILPTLGYQQLILVGAVPARGWLGFLQHHAYLVAFAGFLAYFGASRAGGRVAVPADQAPMQSLRHPLESIYILSAALYSLLVGYLIADYQKPGWAPLLLGTIALTLHFLGACHVVLERFGKLYERLIRWLLVCAMIAGACIGFLTTLRPTIVALWFAFLAGAIIINVLEQELPQREHSRFGWFFAGALFFSTLTLWYQFEAA